VAELQRRHFRKTQQLGCRDSAVAGNNLVALVNQDRVCEAEFLDSGGDLLELFAGMGTCVRG